MIIDSVPTVSEFFTFWGENPDDWDTDRAQLLIELSTELLWLATDLDSDPDDPRLRTLVKYAIADMAVFMYISRDDIKANYSPFQGEKIGSYSYSKSYQHFRQQLLANEPTGVFFFDLVVNYLHDNALYGDSLVTSEQVFHTGYQPLGYASAGLIRSIDPSQGVMPRSYFASYFGNADDDEGFYA